MNLIRIVSLALIIFTGATGLIYEVTWHRYLSNLLGSQAKASALILSTFLGGMCLGYYLFGLFSRGLSRRSLLALTGFAEFLIGVWAYIFPELYVLAWDALQSDFSLSVPSLLLEVLICVFLIGPPTLLMGCTLPLLTPALSQSIADSRGLHAKLYSLNTAGAFVGCLLAGFLLVPVLGLPWTLTVVGPINISVGLLFLLGSRFVSELEPQLEERRDSVEHGFARTWIYYLLAFLAGFYSLCLQMVLMRVVGLSAGASEYSFSMVVAAYIFLLALGAWLLRNRHEVSSREILINQSVLLLSGVLVFVSIDFWPYVTHLLRILFEHHGASFYAYYALLFCCLCFVIFLPVCAMGKMLPLLFGHAAGEGRQLGDLVGRLYAVNTFGCVLGASVGGYFALFWLDLDGVFRLCLGLIALSLPLSLLLEKRTEPFSSATLGLLSFALLLVALPNDWDKYQIGRGTFRKRTIKPASFKGVEAFYREGYRQGELLFYDDGPNTTVAVYEFFHDDIEQRAFSLYVNGKSDGSTRGVDARTTRFLAHLPALFERNGSGEVAVIGFGTGITTGSLALHPSVHSIDLFEISPAVFEAARYFDSVNNHASRTEKLNWILDDAFRVLSRSEKKYALISSEPSNPWVSGVERLYTEDFYKLAKERLAPGGVYAQWVQLYAISTRTLSMIVSAFHKSFPSVRFFNLEGDLIMLGAGPENELELPQDFVKRVSVPEVVEDLASIGIDALTGVVTRELAFAPNIFRSRLAHNLLEPKLSFLAGKDFFSGRKPSFFEIHENPLNLPWTLDRISNFSAWGIFSGSDPELRERDKSLLQGMVLGTCGNPITDLSRAQFEKVTAACLRVSVAAALKGAVALPRALTEAEIKILGFLISPDSTAQPPNELDLLSVFNRYYSPVAGFQTENFLERVKSCSDPESEQFPTCWIRYFLAAIQLGEIEEARRVLELAPTAQAQRFKLVLHQAELVAKMSSEGARN